MTHRIFSFREADFAFTGDFLLTAIHKRFGTEDVAGRLTRRNHQRAQHIPSSFFRGDAALFSEETQRMLVLTRGTGQEIVIDGDIRVTVLGVRGEKVRLGIDAPPSIPVHRQEVIARFAEVPGDKALEGHTTHGG